MFQLIDVSKINATTEPGVFVMDIRFSLDGEEIEGSFGYRPDDTAESTKQIKQWLVDNAGSYTVIPVAEKTIEEIRAEMPNLTARQFWMAAANINIDKDVIVSTIKLNVEDAIERKVMIAELETSSFQRTSETIADIMAMLEIEDTQVDSLWMWASTI